MKTTKTVLLELLIILNLINVLYSQNSSDIRRTYHWYFGNGAGLDFSSGTAVAKTNSPMTAEEGCASISDTCGNLLFFTDGDTVWDRNNNVMTNGTGLMGCWSSTQNSLIIPQPGNDSLYYIFLTDCGEHLGANGLRYSVVNMNLNAGLGEVIEKNTLLFAPAMEKLAATYHANNTDIWIIGVDICHIAPCSNFIYSYYAYLLTEIGINQTPVVSPSNMHFPKLAPGYLRFSHSGNKVANMWLVSNCTVCDSLELFDFDIASGIISNNIVLIPSDSSAGYGVVFSPDDSKLYCSVFDSFLSDYPNWNSKIYQYDLSVNDSVVIASSKTLIHYADSTNPDLPEYMGMQLGSDGRIYIANWNNRGINAYPDTIAIIMKPDSPGLECGFVEKSIYIGGGSQAGLPNFVDSYFNGPWLPLCTTNIEISENTENINCEVNLYPNPFSDYTNIDLSNLRKTLSGTIYIKLYDLFGNIVLQTETNNSYYRIYKEDLNEGIYFLKIQSGNFIYTNKLIIN